MILFITRLVDIFTYANIYIYFSPLWYLIIFIGSLKLLADLGVKEAAFINQGQSFSFTGSVISTIQDFSVDSGNRLKCIYENLKRVEEITAFMWQQK